MKILIFNTLYYPDKIGGAEVSVQILSEELAKTNKVTLVCLSSENALFKKNNVKVIKWKTPNIASVLKIQSKNFAIKIIWHLLDSFNIISFFKVISLIKRENPDVVHFNNLSGFSPSIILAAKILRKKCILTLRDYYIICHKSIAFNKSNSKPCQKKCLECNITYGIKRPFLGLVDEVVALSDGQRQFLKNHTTIPIKNIVPNSVPSGHKIITNSSSQISPRFGFIGRGSVDKGYFYLLNEFKQFALKNNATLHIAGKVNEDNKIISNNIIYHGFIDPYTFFSEIDILIVPSLWAEPFGRVVIEALEAKKIVICSDIGGLSDFSNLENVKLFKTTTGNLCKLLTELTNAQPSFVQTSKPNSLTSFQTAEMYLNIYVQS